MKIGFWKPAGEYGEFSNWYLVGFEYLGKEFISSEQALMWSKAMLFGDAAVAREIMLEKSQAMIKKLGRKVHGFDEATWKANRAGIMKSVLYCKFKQNPDLAEKLLDTGDAEIFEASPYDRIWGIGSSDVDSPRGLNLLGNALMDVRAALAKERLDG